MKKCVFIVFLLFSSFVCLAQNNYIVKTDDGRRVLLKADYTWEYIDGATFSTKSDNKDDLKQKESISNQKSTNCGLASNFKEAKANNKVQARLKKGRSTIKHLKARVAKDYKCEPNEVVLISLNETVQKGTYTLCANGKKVRYKRLGNSFIKRLKIRL